MKKVFKEIIQLINNNFSTINYIIIGLLVVSAFILASMTASLTEVLYIFIILIFILAILYYFKKDNIDRAITLLALLMAVVSPLFVQKMEMKKYQTTFLIEKKINAYELINKELTSLDKDTRDFKINLKQIVENYYKKSKEKESEKLFKENIVVWNDKISNFSNKMDLHRLYSSVALRTKIVNLIEKQIKLKEYFEYLNDAWAKDKKIDKEEEMKKIDLIYSEVYESSIEIYDQTREEITNLLGYYTLSETLLSKSIVL